MIKAKRHRRAAMQMGGMVSTNAGGARAVRHGIMRNHIKGIKVVLADGSVLSLGGKLLKDNAGYNLMHLIIGSEGTLAIVTEVTLRIYPEEKCAELGSADWKRLAEAVKEVIAWGIDTNEMTPEEYLEGRGKEYRNMPHLRVYGRGGQPCSHCGQTIERIVIGGRSSCYCPVCQKKKI